METRENLALQLGMQTFLRTLKRRKGKCNLSWHFLKPYVLLTIPKEDCLLQGEVRWIDEGFSEFYHLRSYALLQL